MIVKYILGITLVLLIADSVLCQNTQVANNGTKKHGTKVMIKTSVFMTIVLKKNSNNGTRPHDNTTLSNTTTQRPCVDRCYNGGTILTSNNNQTCPTCICPVGFSGMQCEIYLNGTMPKSSSTSAPMTCLNGGTYLGSTFGCACRSCYVGSNCQTYNC